MFRTTETGKLRDPHVHVEPAPRVVDYVEISKLVRGVRESANEKLDKAPADDRKEHGNR
jgi:hypothetical protein